MSNEHFEKLIAGAKRIGGASGGEVGIRTAIVFAMLTKALENEKPEDVAEYLKYEGR